MAEYTPRSGFNVGITGGAGGSEAGDLPDTIEAQWIRKLERDLWVRFWGPGVACSDWTGSGETEYDRATGWNQSASYDAGTSGTGTARAGMGDLSGNPDSHISAGSGISTSDPRDAFGYGKFTVLPNITNVSKGTTCTVTCAGHGLLDEAHEGGTLSAHNYIQIVRVPSTSMYQLNEQYFYAKVIDVDTLQLFNNEDLDDPYDSSNHQEWAVGSVGHVNFVIDFVEGTGDAGNYERTTTIARDQYHAIQQRINAAIKRTGQSTFATGTSKALLPLVQTKAMRKSLGETTADINEDTGRVRDAHVNNMSDEIELIGSPLNNSSAGTYNFHKLHVDGIYAPYTTNNKDTNVYSESLATVSGSLASTHAWGSDSWTQNYSGLPWPWSASGGTDYGNDRPFVEARMTFNDWDHMRYWFNQGGCCTFWPHYASNGSWGGNMWAMLARANVDSNTSKVFAGQHNPYHEKAALISSGHIGFTLGGSGNGWGVTGDCPRVHGLGDKANAYFAGSGAATTDGITITGLSTTNMAANDVLHVGGYSGTISSASGGTATLHRILRNIGGTETISLSGQAWACSKWYRACQYNGAGSLYGTDTSGAQSAPGDGGWIHYDWRFVKDPSQSLKPCIFYRMMYDNSGTNCTVHGEGILRLGSRWPDTVDYFYPEQGSPPAISKDNASTAEGSNGMWRT